jgi:hypothetical protein
MNDTAVFAERQKNSFAHHKEITKPFGSLDSIISWCKTELVAEWRWELIEVSTDQRPGRYVFYFDSERDLFAFVLHWS